MISRYQMRWNFISVPVLGRFFYLPVRLLFSGYLRDRRFSKTRVASTVITMLLAVVPVMAQSSEQSRTPVNNIPSSCSLGVFPFIAAQRLESVFAPIAAELDSVMNCSLRYRSAVSYKAFMKKLKNREFDIAFIQPFDYVRIAKLQGYIPLVARNKSLHAIFVTRMDSEVHNAVDLRGRAIALPPPVAAVSYLARVRLDEAGLNTHEDVILRYTKNHGSCLHKALIGKVAACVTAPTTLRLFEEQNNQKMRVIARSPAIPNALFVVRGDIPHEKYHQLRQKMFHLSLSDSGKKLFNEEKFAHPFRAVDDGDYDIVRQYCEDFKPSSKAGDDYQCIKP